MIYLVAGLLIFLGVHSTRLLADGWRSGAIAQVGPGAFKGAYALLSLLGFALLVWGYGQARQMPVVLWTPPAGMRHAAALLTLIAFVMLAATYVPRNAIKAKLKHPMVLATKVWAFAHLLANGTLADVLLFGGFLVWAIVAFAGMRRRDRSQGITYPPGTMGPTLVTVVAGVVAWLLFAMWLHGLLIGVRPFG
jgi:uncharacterized membrane protein